jgi:Pectate lyase superfamily protein
VSTPTTPDTPDRDRPMRTRRAVLAGGAVGAGALGAGLLSPAASNAQVLPPDDRYVWRSRFYLDVKDYGAVGNGSTDDSSPIQSAINAAAAAGGGTVYFPPGDYLVNNGLTIAPSKPIRLLGSGMGLMGNGSAALPTRIVRKSPSTTTILSASGTSFTNRVAFEVADIEFHGTGTAGLLVDVQMGNTVQFHQVRFAGATAIGLRMRNIFNSTGSHLRFAACGNGASAPACMFDGVSGGQGGSDTVLWDNVQFEGNNGTDLKLTGNATNDAGTVTNVVQMSQVKMEGGTSGAVNCPYIDLDYSQGCFFSDVNIGVHGGRTVTPVRKAHPFGGTRADKFVNLHVDNVGSETFPYGIEHFKAGLQLENVTVLGASTAAIKVNSSVGTNEFQLGNLLTNVGRAVIDARTSIRSVASGASITPPREHLVQVTGGTTITQIDPHEASYVMTLVFTGALTVTDGGNLKLAGNLTTTADDTLTLVSDGTNWFEVSRSVN